MENHSKINACDGDLYDEFGDSVTISGDMLIIGAPGKDFWKNPSMRFYLQDTDFGMK